MFLKKNLNGFGSSIKFSVLLSVSVILISAFFFSLLPADGDIFMPTLSQPASQKIVILDPGHGGVDSGAVSCTGSEEKNLNLELSKKLGAFLEAGGVRVVYTRVEDTLLSSHREGTRKTKDLMGRVEIAQQYPDAVYLSLHMNTLPQERYKGLQCFYANTNSDSKRLAESIQSTVINLIQPENTRKAKDANGSIFILDRIECPAALVECGFLTNPEEAALLEDGEYQEKLAFSISRAILDYMSE